MSLNFFNLNKFQCQSVAITLASAISFGQLSPVYIFRHIRATFPSGVKNDLRPSFGLMLFLTRPKFSAISRRGSNFVSCPIRSFRKLNSRARKNRTPETQCLALFQKKFRTFDMQINFAIPPIFHFRRWLGNSFLFFKVTKFLSLYQSTRCVIIEHFTTDHKL